MARTVQGAQMPSRREPRHRKRVLIASGLVAFVALLMTAGFLVGRSRSVPALAGGLFSDAPPAPDFSLIDHKGQPFSLASSRGKVVALTFLYVHCPDVCPVIANKMAGSVAQLGPDAQNVDMLAVSMDPVGDTRLAVTEFTRAHGLDSYNNWHYLLGSPSELRGVWSGYHVDAQPDPSGSPFVGHSALIYLIDRAGKLRVILDANFAPADFLQDVKALLRS